jgi:predicted RNA-binding Zn ribbon-like protein
VSRSTTIPLPTELELPLAFVNTLDVEESRDEFGSAGALQAWLSGRALLAGDIPVTRRELALAIELRDALRRVFLAHSGASFSTEELESVNRVLARVPLDVRVDAAGAPDVAPRGEGVAAALGQIVCDVSRARTSGTWNRLKLCPAEDCLWAFFDSSKNRSRRWCSMDVCGNRTKTREYRRRVRSRIHAPAG